MNESLCQKPTNYPGDIGDPPGICGARKMPNSDMCFGNAYSNNPAHKFVSAAVQAGGGDEAVEAGIRGFISGFEWNEAAGGGLRAALDELLAAMREPDWVKSAPGFDTYSFSDRFAAAVERAVALVATPQQEAGE